LLPELENFASPIETVHEAVPGRARFHVHDPYNVPDLKHTIERGLAAFSQVNRVTANPLTGNVLVEFDQRVDATRIAELLRGTLPDGRNGYTSANANTRAARSVSDVPVFHSTSQKSASRPAQGTPDKSAENAWHCSEVEAAADRLGSSRRGLSAQTAAERLESSGPNRLPERGAHSPFTVLLDQFDSMPTALLIAAAGI
jgi:Ca2+-transporting ATPase